ncbi:hypothetical protein [Streptomyces sp. NPDC090994]|uniref:hypothetical protein n=1 Tax=Streptomyces sp. NPDC090994 TaxID=3365969 RepID=UPI0037FF1447
MTMPQRLQQMASELYTAGLQLELLDSAGQVPSPLPVDQLQQQVIASRALAARTTLLAADFASRTGSDSSEYLGKARAELATAVTHTYNAVRLFTETASITAAATAHPDAPGGKAYEGRLVLAHADARGNLWRASEAITRAAQHLEMHRSVEQFLTDMRVPAPADPGTSPRHNHRR